MGEGTNGGNGRLDRIEQLMERLVEDHLLFRDEHRQLLKSQVLLTDIVEKHGKAINTLDEKMILVSEAQRELVLAQKELAESQKNTDDRLAALIHIVDDIIRRPPPQ